MPSITIPWLGRGGRNQGGNSNNNNQQRPPALSPEEQLNLWRGSGIPEPPMPPPNPMPVPQVPDLNYGGGQTNWMPPQGGGGQVYGNQPSGWDMRNWYRPDIPYGNDGRTNWMPPQGGGGKYGFGGGDGQTNWMPRQQDGGGKGYGLGGGKGYGLGGGSAQGMDMRSMGGLFEALMRLFQ